MNIVRKLLDGIERKEESLSEVLHKQIIEIGKLSNFNT